VAPLTDVGEYGRAAEMYAWDRNELRKKISKLIKKANDAGVAEGSRSPRFEKHSNSCIRRLGGGYFFEWVHACRTSCETCYYYKLFYVRIMALPAHRRVAAPMVGCSDLAFRLLCRRYGADLTYTEMLYADRFVGDEEYRQTYFLSQISSADRPLVVQFGGNDAPTLVAAALLAQPHCDAVDLNLGCPQKRACEGLYGAYLADREHWPRVFAIVRALVDALAVPVFCKIRLQPTLAETVRFARGLQAAGCGLLAVHGRQRGSATRRRAGPADLSAVRAIKHALRIPVLTNGNVRRASDIEAALRRTRADGAMVAEPLLRNPSILQHGAADRPSLRHRLLLLLEYLELAAAHPPPELQYARHHLSWGLGRDGAGARLRYKHVAQLVDAPALREALTAATSLHQLREVVTELVQRLDDAEAARVSVHEEAARSVGTRAFWCGGVVVFE